MQLEHSFTVPVGVDTAWPVLLDIERIAPCMPGAAVDSVDGDDFTGTVKVKLGPIGLTYKGNASFIEKDEGAHRAVIDARGRDARGNGTATAKVTATLTEVDDGATRVDVITDLDITGKPAQFGRGVMEDVGNKLIGQFADCLANKLGEGDTEQTAAEPPAGAAATPAENAAAAKHRSPADTASAPAAAASTSSTSSSSTPPASPTPAQAPQPRTTPAPDIEPINLIESAGPAIAKRLAPIALLAVVLLLVFGRRKRRS